MLYASESHLIKVAVSSLLAGGVVRPKVAAYQLCENLGYNNRDRPKTR